MVVVSPVNNGEREGRGMWYLGVRENEGKSQLLSGNARMQQHVEETSPEMTSWRRTPAGARGGRSAARERAKNVTEMHKIKAKVIGQGRWCGVACMGRNRSTMAAGWADYGG